MQEPIVVGRLEDLPCGGRRSVVVAGEEVTVLRPAPDQLLAIGNRCPHHNGRLGDGQVQNGEIVCPLHRWRFDVKTGRTRRDRSVRARIYPVWVADGTICVGAVDPVGQQRRD